MTSSNGRENRPWWRTPAIAVPAAVAIVVAVIGIAPELLHSGSPSSRSTSPTPSSNTTPASPITPSSTSTGADSTTVGPNTTETGTSIAGPPIRHKGLLLIRNNLTYDLDSTAPNWSSQAGGRPDLLAVPDTNQGELIIFQNSDNARVDAGDESSYATCKAANINPNSSHTRLHSELADGQRFCVRTSEDRLSLIEIKVQQFDTITAEVTTWEPQGSA